MVAVNVVDGIKYGFRLLGYLLAVAIIGGILVAIGGSFTPGPMGRGGNPILAFIFVLAGAAVIYAGGLGILYKVIADGVERGNLSANQGGGLGGMSGSFGGSGGQGGGANRARANQARQGAQPAGQGGQGTQGARGNQGGQQRTHQGGQQPQQGGRGANQGGQGNESPRDDRGTGDQQPPQDWEPGN